MVARKQRNISTGTGFSPAGLMAAGAAWAENQELRERIAELEAHEEQTHERLGEILGHESSLEDMARLAMERIRNYRNALRVMVDVFRPRNGEPDKDMYVECEAHALARETLRRNGEDEG